MAVAVAVAVEVDVVVDVVVLLNLHRWEICHKNRYKTKQLQQYCLHNHRKTTYSAATSHTHTHTQIRTHTYVRAQIAAMVADAKANKEVDEQHKKAVMAKRYSNDNNYYNNNNYYYYNNYYN